MLATVLMSVALFTPAASAATHTGPHVVACPGIRFFGAHGTNEDGPGDPADQWLGMGETVAEVWQAFTASPKNHQSADFEAVDFEKTSVDIKALLQPVLPVFDDVRLRLVKLSIQLSQLEPGADKAAAALANQIWRTYQECGAKTRYILVGYSQGAWGIDKVLRGDGPLAPVLSPVLEQVSGVYLMGDPAWPADAQSPGRQGAATAIGRGVSYPYVPVAVANRFRSMCVSYAGDVYDSICMLGGNAEKFFPGIDAHYTYKSNGMAINGGEWLSSVVG
jgi:hypothetical protein